MFRSSSLLPAAVICALALALPGCVRGPRILPADKQGGIDRSTVEYPAEFTLTPFAENLTAPVAMAFEESTPGYKGAMLIAESGAGGHEPAIYGFKTDGSQFRIYPRRKELFFVGGPIRMYGPLGGMITHNGRIYVSHRDANGMGVITSFDYEGNPKTVVADLPAQGDFAITDLAMHPTNGRLYFGLGAATNSGVVGLDNWASGWLDEHPDFSDRPFQDIKLTGFRFTTTNPRGGLFGGDDIAVTPPLQPFNATQQQLRVPASVVKKPTAAVYSVNPDGGDLKVEAHGIRLPRGLVFNEYNNLFVTNNGMELRGTRPVKDDPDSVLRVPLGGQIWYGWPDFTADLQPVSLPRFQPPELMIVKTGYREIAAVIDQESSGLPPPDRARLLRGVFPSLSGAAKMAFVGEDADESFRPYRGSLIVALSGDRAPFASNNQPLTGPQGYRVVRVEYENEMRNRPVTDFVVNTQRKPVSMTGGKTSLERPIDVKFGPDGSLYILDFGRMEMKDGKVRVWNKTGRVFRLAPLPKPPTSASTQPVTTN